MTLIPLALVVYCYYQNHSCYQYNVYYKYH